MKRYPLSHKSMHSWRQDPNNDFGCRNRDFCLISTVLHVEVRRRMLAVIHLDHDPVELADAGHTATLEVADSRVVR
jgi:hypothetical protein